MLDIAASIGMSEADFWGCTPGYFYAMVKHYRAEYWARWEQARFIAYVTAKTVDSKKRLRRPSDLLQLPTDSSQEKQFKKPTKAEREEMKKFDAEADLILAKTQPELWANILKLREEEAQKNGG